MDRTVNFRNRMTYNWAAPSRRKLASQAPRNWMTGPHALHAMNSWPAIEFDLEPMSLLRAVFCQRQDLGSGFRHQNGVFELCRRLSIASTYGPAIMRIAIRLHQPL